MEEKNYEAGKVEISSAEYRDLVTEAVTARRDASESRSEKWRLESERDKLKKELEEAYKRIADLERMLAPLQVSVTNTNHPPFTIPWWEQIGADINDLQKKAKEADDYVESQS